ncbi:dihydrodipicolinate synthase family protein [Actinotalea sp. K2]|uniref:dihydrodipicolinate synthase family protein n=1 Tax=Actinotalea sp. K2 TaxID=2939438 RepID=UPI0020180C1E|nr:dihydrodipicolinate synthase family protein [Actinotalea sp. K2]MCL3861927.1 dihydrodipicolinate synthase family protein [Actinotalea sp. K2]
MPLLGPLVAYLPTPRSRDGEVDDASLTALADLADRAVLAGVDGIALLGSTGGFAYLDRAARRRVVQVGVEAVCARVPVVVGVGALTTREVLVLAQDAQEAGVSALLLPTTSYLPLLDDEVLELYRTVGEHAEVPVWAYHNPVTTRVALSLEMLCTLARTPGIGGIKDRGVDADEVRRRARYLGDRVPAGIEIGFSGDGHGYAGLLEGASTWHSGLAGVLPGPYTAVARAAASQDPAAAQAAMAPLEPVVGLALASGGPRVVHLVGEILGLRLGALPPPLLPPSAPVRAELERLLGVLGG